LNAASRCYVSQDIEYIFVHGISDRNEAEGETRAGTVDGTYCAAGMHSVLKDCNDGNGYEWVQE
jgi:hypothetical protein